MAKHYEVIEHTADIGIRVKARDLSGLFKAAGLAIFELSAQKLPTKDKQLHKISIGQKGADIEELFVNWLNELLSLSSAEGVIFEDLHIEKMENNEIDAVAIGSDIKNYKVNTEIKAATYHELSVKNDKSGWTAEVIFDV